MILSVESVSKEYRIFDSFRDRALTALSLGLIRTGRPFLALNDITFRMGEEKKGEILGILGRNGAGKSTLLNILSGISHPTNGKIHFDGTIRSILELGVGFNPDLTAEQNIYYNGVLWGYSASTLRERIDEILDFALLQDYRHSALKTMSTGMQMRLAFSLATLEPADLLLVDEALSVGDASFQSRSIKRFREFRNTGSQIIVVSHDTNMLLSVCDRIIVMESGKIIMEDSPGKAARFYMDLLAGPGANADLRRVTRDSKRFDLKISDEAGNPVETIRIGGSISIFFSTRAESKMEDMTAGILIRNERGDSVFGTNTRLLGTGPLNYEKGEEKVVRFDLHMNLAPGRYYTCLALHSGLDHATGCYIWEEDLAEIQILGKANQDFQGNAYLNPVVSILKESSFQ